MAHNNQPNNNGNGNGHVNVPIQGKKNGESRLVDLQVQDGRIVADTQPGVLQ